MSETESDAFESLDMAVYARKVFGMFSGEEEAVQLRFENRLVGAVLDRLGHDDAGGRTAMHTLRQRANVVVSPQFFAWVSGFGPAAQIVAPDEVVRAMAAHIRSVARQYEHIDIDTNDERSDCGVDFETIKAAMLWRYCGRCPGLVEFMSRCSHFLSGH